MSSARKDLQDGESKSLPRRFLFVNSDGRHATVNPQTRSHVSRENRRATSYGGSLKPVVRFISGRENQISNNPSPRPRTSRKKVVPPDWNASKTRKLSREHVSCDAPKPTSTTPTNSLSDWQNSKIFPDENTFVVAPSTIEIHYPGGVTPGWSQASLEELVLDDRERNAYPDDERAVGFEQLSFDTSLLCSSIYSMPLDEFDSLPLRLNRIDQTNLLSFQIIPDTVYQVPGRTTINNHRDWGYPIIIKTPMLIHAAMAVVVQGREMRMKAAPSAASFAYKYSTIKTLNEWIEDPVRRNSPEVLIGIAALAAGEHYQGWSPNLFLHVRAFFQVLRARGGWPSFEHDKKTGWFLFGQAIIWSQVTVASMDQPTVNSPMSRASLEADIQDLFEALDDLLNLLSRWISWSSRRDFTTRMDRKSRIRYTELLGEHTILFKLFRSPGYLNSNLSRTAEVERSHQIFAIIYLVLVKWEHRDKPERFLDFLSDLSLAMRQHEVITTSTTIPLVWLLVQGVDHSPERKIRTLGLLKVCHRIRTELREQLVNFLVALLRLEHEADDVVLSSEDLKILDRDVEF